MSSPSASESCLPGRTDTPDRICGYNRIRKPIEKPLPFSGDGKSAAMTGRALLLFRSYPPRIVVVLFLFRFAGGGGHAVVHPPLAAFRTFHLHIAEKRSIVFFGFLRWAHAALPLPGRISASFPLCGGAGAGMRILSLFCLCAVNAMRRTGRPMLKRMKKRHLHPREAGNRCPFPCVRKHRESKADPFYRTSVFRRHKHGGQRIQ